MKFLDEFISEKFIINKRAEDEFNKYSGTTLKDAERFVNICIKKIPEWKDFTFELFYSGYAGYTISNNDNTLGYLLYDKTVYGLEDIKQGIGWYFEPKIINSKTKQWEEIVKKISDKDSSKPAVAGW